jgi:hypothetical protein
MRGRDIWPNIAYTKVDGREYIVYALFNADTTTGDKPPFPDQPAVGPSTLTVFDATAGEEKWTLELNNANQTGNYPDLRPGYFENFFEVNRMVVTGRYAYIAWVDTATGPDLTLKVAGVDITAEKAPSLPAPFTLDLKVPIRDTPEIGRGNKQTRVPDMIAADGDLYILVDESPDLKRSGHVHAQQVIALTGR